MGVFLTGATGVLGGRLVERLADRDHEVIGLVRDDDGAALVEARGGVPRYGDVLDPGSLERVVQNVAIDTVVHAATALPVKTKPSEAEWARNDRVRREGARNLLAAVDDIDRFVFPSVVWIARRPNGSRFDESAPRNPDRTTRSAADVKRLLEDRAADREFDATILRCGFFYAPDAGHTRSWGEALLSGDLPIVGGGLLGRRNVILAFLHAEDAARAVADAIEANATGCYHVVDDRPVPLAEFLTEFADRLDTSEPSRIPGWLARFFVGKETVDMLTNPMATSAERFERDVGWKPVYPTYEAGLPQVVETWRTDGSLRETAEGYEWAGD